MERRPEREGASEPRPPFGWITDEVPEQPLARARACERLRVPGCVIQLERRPDVVAFVAHHTPPARVISTEARDVRERLLHQIGEVARAGKGQHLPFRVGAEQPRGVPAHHVEHEHARSAVTVAAANEALVEQRSDRIHVRRRDLLERGNGAAAAKERQSTVDPLLLLRQQA